MCVFGCRCVCVPVHAHGVWMCPCGCVGTCVGIYEHKSVGVLSCEDVCRYAGSVGVSGMCVCMCGHVCRSVDF